ncbi:MAG TPA: hypothetical protein VFB62_24285, partial [Polyangiaceae bacterium]|nr:hypothetical protein [Polyangiaceae bacterium]
APGYFGAYQFSVYAGLAMFYAEADVTGVGSAVVFALYVLHMGLPLVIAIVALALMRLTPARAMAAAVAAERDPN